MFVRAVVVRIINGGKGHRLGVVISSIEEAIRMGKWYMRRLRDTNMFVHVVERRASRLLVSMYIIRVSCFYKRDPEA